MARRAPRAVLLSLLVLAAVLVALDIAGRVVAQDDLASRAQAATGAQRASASISGFPFLWHLVVDGEVSGAQVRLSEVPVGTLELQELDVDLSGVRLDRAALVGHRRVHVLAVDAATATVTISAAALSAAAGVPVAIAGQGQVLVQVAGRAIPASVAVEPGDVLVVEVAGRAVLRADLETSPVVPDCAMALHVGVGTLEVSCHVAPVPARVVHAVSSD